MLSAYEKIIWDEDTASKDSACMLWVEKHVHHLLATQLNSHTILTWELETPCTFQFLITVPPSLSSESLVHLPSSLHVLQLFTSELAQLKSFYHGIPYRTTYNIFCRGMNG